MTEDRSERDIRVGLCVFLILFSIVASAFAIWFFHDQGLISVALWCSPGIVGLSSGLILLPAALNVAKRKVPVLTTPIRGEPRVARSILVLSVALLISIVSIALLPDLGLAVTITGLIVGPLGVLFGVGDLVRALRARRLRRTDH